MTFVYNLNKKFQKFKKLLSKVRVISKVFRIILHKVSVILVFRLGFVYQVRFDLVEARPLFQVCRSEGMASP